ncbi:hypothetical protein CGU37_28435 [Pseudomonas fluorescens]|nr:hypothetical protein CGU37_28435 [Pseudomonas fluorescens]
MSQQIDSMREMFTQSEANRAHLDQNLASLAVSIERLTDRMAGTARANDAMLKMAESQDRLIEILTEQGADGMDPESRMRLRSIDVQLLRILEEISAGRQETMAELRTDISALAQVLRARRKRPQQPDGQQEG